jgi:hypothetical protein
MATAMRAKRFQAKLAQTESRVFVPIPFDPNLAWGQKVKHYITGAVNSCPVRGPLEGEAGAYRLPLGAAWRRDSGLKAGDAVQVELSPEGPQVDTLPPDVARALASEPAARRFFEGLATFYRKNFMRGIESAKRPETRAKRVAEMVALLKAGKREK